jgi:hypothetical protein
MPYDESIAERHIVAELKCKFVENPTLPHHRQMIDGIKGWFN